MHGMYVKITGAQQAKIYVIKNIKLVKTNTAIWFNKMRRTKQITSKYIRIKVSGNNIHKQE
jgi:hypothetical protein